jgi:hypothetical protein
MAQAGAFSIQGEVGALSHRRRARWRVRFVHEYRPAEALMLYQRAKLPIPIGIDHCVIPNFDPALGAPVMPPQRLPLDPFDLHNGK